MEKLQRLGESRTSQVFGDGNGLLLTRNGEDEEIVYSLLERGCVELTTVYKVAFVNKCKECTIC